MENLWDTQTILKKKYRGKTDKNIEKKNALKTGNFVTEKKTLGGNKPTPVLNTLKLDNHNLVF